MHISINSSRQTTVYDSYTASPLLRPTQLQMVL
jgi:hypothetical protein